MNLLRITLANSKTSRTLLIPLRNLTLGLVLSTLCSTTAVSQKQEIQNEPRQKTHTIASFWSLNHRTVESSKIPGLFLTQLDFIKGTRKESYLPEEPPYGFGKVRVLNHGSKQIFVTSWAFGARSLLIRVFAPETNGATPLCPTQRSFENLISFSQRLDARIRDNKTEVFIMDSEGNKRWQICE